jgi:hypothetical protein
MQLGDATYDVVLCQQGLQPALRGSQSGDLAAGTVNHQPNFLAARLNGTENRHQKPGNLANVG